MTKYTQPHLDQTNDFLNGVIATQELKNDAALARFVDLPPPIVSKLRHGHIDFNFGHVVAFHINTNIPVRKIMQLVGIEKIVPAV